jgi:uncharacterized protein (TIGR02118 family)
VITAVIFFRRQPDLTLEAFHEHWRTQHAELVVRLPGLRRYVQNYPLVATERSAGTTAFDAVAESTFDDTQAMKALARTPEYAAVLADERNFIDPASMGSVITEEHVLKDGPAPPEGLKSIGFVTRQAPMPIDEFFRRWLEDGSLWNRVAPARRYVQFHARRAIYDSGRTPVYDGAEMSWFDGTQAQGTASATPEFARLRENAENLIAIDRSPCLLVREHVVRA